MSPRDDVRSTNRQRGWRAGRACVLLLALVAAGSAHAGPRNVKPGDAVGTLRLKDLSGQAVDASSWSGRPSVWLFVAPQQTSSEQALIELQKVVDEMPPPGVAAVALTGDVDHLFELREFVARQRIRLPVVLDAGRVIYGRIGVIVLPTALIVDGNGTLHAAIPGHDPSFERTLRIRLKFLMGKLTADELAKQLAATQPARNLAREMAERLTHSAAVLAERGLPGEAAKELAQAIAADPTFTAAPLDLAVLKMGQGDVAGADALVQGVLRAAPHERHAQLVLGIVQFQQKRLDEAGATLEKAILLNPDPALTNYWLGRVYEAKGEGDRARARYRAAAERMLPAAHVTLARRGEIQAKSAGARP